MRKHEQRRDGLCPVCYARRATTKGGRMVRHRTGYDPADSEKAYPDGTCRGWGRGSLYLEEIG